MFIVSKKFDFIELKLFENTRHISDQLILNLELDAVRRQSKRSAEPKPLTIAIFWSDHLRRTNMALESSAVVWLVVWGAELGRSDAVSGALPRGVSLVSGPPPCACFVRRVAC